MARSGVGHTGEGIEELVFPARVRIVVSVAAAVSGVAIIAASTLVPDGRQAYVVALVLAAAPFATAGLVFTSRCVREGPVVYRGFWQRWLAAAATAYLAGAAALAGVVLGVAALLVLAMLLLIAAVPLWCAASLRMLQAQVGRRTASVDLLDAAMALAVLGAPAVLLFAEPLSTADHPAFVLPFVVSVALVPGGLYLSFVGLSLVPRGERATQGIGMALGGAFALNATVQLAQVLSDFTLPIPVIVTFQVVNMGLLMAVPLWAHRYPTSILDGLLPEQQVRRADPLTITSALFLPAVAVLAWIGRDERSWGVAFVLGVFAVVAVLGAIRHALLLRETRALHGEVERVAEERRRLLANMVRAIEDDRARVAGELHVQAVESFAALGALIQRAHATLPADSARVVQEALSQVQDDLSTRADALRRLTAAARPPAFAPGGVAAVHDGALATALRAFAADVLDQRSATVVRVEVDDDLELDWATTTIVYRIAQEALRNVAEHAEATAVRVSVGEEDGAVVVVVADDGLGFDRSADHPGAGTASMALFAELGGGRVEVDGRPGEGTAVRAILGGVDRPGTSRPTPRRLVLVDTLGPSEATIDLR